MRRLVIGCGYLGERVAAAWRDAGDRVTALTRSEERAVRFRQSGFEAFVGDVTRPESLKALPPADTVLYAVGFDRTSGGSRREISVDGLENVLTELAGRVGRLLYVSSTSVYGQSQGEWVDEDSPCEPTRANGQVSLDAERVVRRFFPIEGCGGPANAPAADIVRLAGIYGPGRLLRRLESLRAGDPLPGDPEAWLNLIHVDDAAAVLSACERRGRGEARGRVFLVCDDRPIRRREYYGRLASLAGAPPPVFAEHEPIEAAERSLGKRCSNRRIHEELQVRLQFPSIETGLPHALGSS